MLSPTKDSPNETANLMELDEFYDVVNEMFHDLRYHVRLVDCQSAAQSPIKHAVATPRRATHGRAACFD